MRGQETDFLYHGVETFDYDVPVFKSLEKAIFADKKIALQEIPEKYGVVVDILKNANQVALYGTSDDRKVVKELFDGLVTNRTIKREVINIGTPAERYLYKVKRQAQASSSPPPPPSPSECFAHLLFLLGLLVGNHVSSENKDRPALGWLCDRRKQRSPPPNSSAAKKRL